MTRRRKHARHQSSPDPELTCAFCNADIHPDHEAFGFGAKAKPDADLESYRGTAIEVTVESLQRTVTAFVTGRDSPAAREGYDLYFTTCSASCGKALQAVLVEEIKGVRKTSRLFCARALGMPRESSDGDDG